MREYVLNDIDIGMKESFSQQITDKMEDAFRNVTGDENPLHFDDQYAVEIGKGKYRKHIVFGMLTASFLSTMAGMYLPGKYSLIHSIENISFIRPVYVGDALTIEGEVIEKNQELRLIRIRVTIKNQDNNVVSKAKMKILVLR